MTRMRPRLRAPCGTRPYVLIYDLRLRGCLPTALSLPIALDLRHGPGSSSGQQIYTAPGCKGTGRSHRRQLLARPRRLSMSALAPVARKERTYGIAYLPFTSSRPGSLHGPPLQVEQIPVGVFPQVAAAAEVRAARNARRRSRDGGCSSGGSCGGRRRIVSIASSNC